MKVLRIKLVPTPESEHHNPFYFDVFVDEAGNLSGKHAIFGIQGKFERNAEEFYPCCVLSDGQLDYGSAYEPGDRFGQTDLRDVVVSKDALVRFSISDGDDLLFRIHIERSFP